MDSEHNPAANIITTVRASALVADVVVSVWTGKRTVTVQEAQQGVAAQEVVNLLAGADKPLKAALSAFTAVRSAHADLTLPWNASNDMERSRGGRLLPARLVPRYLATIAGKRKEALAALEAFVAEYPALITEAQAKRPELADYTVFYPTADDLRGMFRVSIEFEPLPCADDFTTVLSEALTVPMAAKLSAGLTARLHRMIEIAQKGMWDEVRGRVAYLVERLGTGEDGTPHRFRAATVETVRELIEIMPAWNITGDGRAHLVAEALQKLLGDVTPEMLRKDDVLRKSVCDIARAILHRLDQWGC